MVVLWEVFIVRTMILLCIRMDLVTTLFIDRIFILIIILDIHHFTVPFTVMDSIKVLVIIILVITTSDLVTADIFMVVMETVMDTMVSGGIMVMETTITIQEDFLLGIMISGHQLIQV